MSKLRRQVERILADLPRHREQLDAAMAQFGEDFDLDAYLAAWSSADPRVRNEVASSIREFEVLQNHLFSLAQLGFREAQRLGAVESSSSGTPFGRLRDLNVVSSRLCEQLERLQDLRNRLQHVYPQVRPEEVHEGVRALRAEVSRFVDGYERWLSGLDRD